MASALRQAGHAITRQAGAAGAPSNSAQYVVSKVRFSKGLYQPCGQCAQGFVQSPCLHSIPD